MNCPNTPAANAAANADARCDAYAAKLARLIAYETVSVQGAPDPDKFRGFHQLLRESFPALFAACDYEDFEGSLLLRWPGTDPSLKPSIFMNHHDVVEPQEGWSHPPFAGEIADGRLYGRGSIDNKAGLFCMLQAADELAAAGFVPRSDIYFESACTEEIDGQGCAAIGAELQKRGLRFRLCLDEGGAIVSDPLAGSGTTCAMVGVGEKSTVSLRFTAAGAGGHAAVPNYNEGLVRLGKFMADADKPGLFQVSLSEPLVRSLQLIAPHASGPLGFVFKHAQGLRPLLQVIFPRISANTRAMSATSLAFTMAGGADAYNVLPARAWVIGNMRCSHQQGVDDSIAAVSKLAAKHGIEVEVVEKDPESSLSSYEDEAFRLFESAVSACFPGTLTLPYIMNGCSDSRFIAPLSDSTLRFVPLHLDQQQLDSIHGIDENINIADLAPAVDFYRYLMREDA